LASPGLSAEHLVRAPARTPPSCFGTCSSADCKPPAPRSLNRCPVGSISITWTSQASRPNSPPEVSAPFQTCRPSSRQSGIWVLLAGAPTSLSVTTLLFGLPSHPAEADGPEDRCQASKASWLAKPACGPFRGFGIDRSGSPSSPRRPILSWNRLLVQSSPPSRYRAYWLRVPVSPLALASALRFFQLGDGASVKQTRQHLSSSSAFLQSLSRSHLAKRAAGTVARLLSWASLPFSTCRTRGSTYRGFTSPASFRPQGLATLSTVFSPRVRAGPVSCRQRSWDFALRSISLSQGTRHVPATDEPACRPSGC
jgi:hypothetical protein